MNDEEKWKLFSKIKVKLPNKEVNCISSDEIQDKNAQEVLQFLVNKFNLNGNFSLYFISPTTEWCLENEPINNFFDYIVFMPNSKKPHLTNIQFYLQIKEFQENRLNSFVIPVCDNDGNFLFSYSLSITRPFKFNDICYLLSVLLDNNPSNLCAIDLKHQNINLETQIDDPFILQKCYFIAKSFTKTSQILKSFNQRSNAMKDFFNSLNRYKQFLILLQKSGMSLIKQYELLFDYEISKMEKCISNLMDLNDNLISDYIENRKTTKWGKTFVYLAMNLSYFNEYISLYNKIQMVILKKKKINLFFSRACEKIEAQGEMQGLTVDSLFMESAQRIPKYVCKLNELISLTPEFHPDYASLIFASSLFKEASVQQNLLVNIEKSDEKPKDYIPSEFETYHYKEGCLKICTVKLFKPFSHNDATIQDTNTNDVENSPIQAKASFFEALFNGNKQISDPNNRYIVFTYQGIRIFEFENNQIIDQFDTLINYSDINLEKNKIENQNNYYYFIKHRTNESISLAFTFANNAKAAEFLIDIKSHALQSLDSEIKNMPSLQWSIISTAPAPLQGCGMAIVNKRIYIICGKNSIGFPTSDMLIYNIDTNEWERKETPLLKRYGLCVTSLDNNIYCYGGVSLSEECKDFWIYDTNTDQWSEGVGTELSGAGLAMTHWQNEFIVLAGGLKFKTYIYNIEQRTWRELQPNSQIQINTLLNHSLVEHGDNLYLISGVKSNTTEEGQFNKKIYVLKPASDYWTISSSLEYGFTPIEAFNQCAVSFKSYIWLFARTYTTRSLIYLQNDNRWGVFPNTNQYNKNLFNASACNDKDEFIYVFGGQTEQGLSPTLYKLEAQFPNK